MRHSPHPPFPRACCDAGPGAGILGSMHTRRSRIPLLVVVAALGVVGFGTAGHARSPDPTGASGSVTPHSNVSELITFVPPSTQSIAFTDWGRIKASQGAQDVTGASPIEDKLPVAFSTAKGEAAASGFGLAHLRNHYDTWGWDSLDLDWEANISGDGAPVWVLRFRDGFDLGPVAARFDERGFSTTTVPGATIRSHAMDVSADWLRRDRVRHPQHRLPRRRPDPGPVELTSTRSRMWRPTTAAFPPSSGCRRRRASSTAPPQRCSCRDWPRAPASCRCPSTSAIHSPALTCRSRQPGCTRTLSWASAMGAPTGTPSAASASATSMPPPPRPTWPGVRRWPALATSVRAREPYADAVFQVVDGRVDGAILTLDVSPVAGQPRRLFDMVYARDMVFAAADRCDLTPLDGGTPYPATHDRRIAVR